MAPRVPRRVLLQAPLLLPACAATPAAPERPIGRTRAADAPDRPAPTTIRSHAAPYPTFGGIERIHGAFDYLIPGDAELEKLAEGFDWTEGPVWVKDGGFLLFSDIPPNAIYKWREGAGVRLFMQPAGYHGKRTDIPEPGANGLALDARGDLLMCQHGDRRVARLVSWLKPHGEQEALATGYRGKRLNSPNDLVLHRSGAIFFTDPPYGLATQALDDPDKQLPFQGVFRLDPNGDVVLLTDKIERPNGIALSPDQKTLYVANSHLPRPIWLAYPLKDDLSLGEGRVLFDATAFVKQGRPGAPDGMAVDERGNLFATGPGGVLVISPEGQHLGTIKTGEKTANCAFGDADGRTLYVCADMFLARIRTTTRGLGFDV